MAVTAVTTRMSGAINYTHVTDTSADWASVANSTYFYDKADKIVRYKDASGVISDALTTSLQKNINTTYTTNAITAVTAAEYMALTPVATTIYFVV
jgi:hypothetical protein